MRRVSQWMLLLKMMGIRYFAFRIFFEFKKKTGLLRRAFPTNPSFRSFVTFDAWKKQTPAFFFQSRLDLAHIPKKSSAIKEKVSRIFKNEWPFFHGQWKLVDQEDWLTNPSTSYRYDSSAHWTEIPDFDRRFGDIKFVWERSRFAFVQDVLRYDIHTDSDSSAWIFNQIESWITHNPVNQGPNYRCSQEISLRVFNWVLALYFYKNSPQLSEERFQRILFSIYWQVRHVYSNINFSRIAVRNNHAVTETLLLYSAGCLFPFFPEAAQWKKQGKKWFEEEIRYQIYPDGGYLQFSFNYQRVVIQLLTWGIALGRHHNEQFAQDIELRANASLRLLLHAQDPVTGKLPNYGANDGSLFFSWNDNSFRDFTGALDALHYLLTSKNFYSSIPEDRYWFGLDKGIAKVSEKINTTNGSFSFPESGIYVNRMPEVLTFINCVNYEDRPSQADNLHLDIWYKGVNFLRDAGSFQYNTSAELSRYFFGTESHNTVMVGAHDQMQKGPRFIWFNWSQAGVGNWTESPEYFQFEGKIQAFSQLGSYSHSRKVQIHKTLHRWVIEDTVSPVPSLAIRQLWHPIEHWKEKFTITVKDKSGMDVPAIETERWYSETYGEKRPSPQLEFNTFTGKLITEIVIAA
jgi:hypothetical protein